MEISCRICGQSFDSYRELSNHLRFYHKILSKDYYDKYLKKEGEGVCQTCR